MDDPYCDADLVELYDLDNPDSADHAYYRALSDEIGARTILDLGCGTGLLTRSLAGPERTVIGVDPSRTMLDYARRQPGADSVTWIHGDASAIQSTGTADLAISTGNAIMHVSPETLPSALRSLAGALRTGGRFSFDSRNPAYREWERWTRGATYGERITPVGPWVSDGEVRVYTNVLYFRTVEEFERELHAAGFTDIDVRGDWHGAPVDDSSRLLVFRARKA